MNKIEALNSLEVTDWECSGEECEYVLAANTPENKKILLDAGFSDEELTEALGDDPENEIDLSMLAFNYTEANWYTHGAGFGTDNPHYRGGIYMSEPSEQLTRENAIKAYALLSSEALAKQLQQTREGLERMKGIYEQERGFSGRFQRERDTIQAELEQVNAEREENKKFTEAAAVGVVKLQNEIESLHTELSEKDKVLGWYAAEDGEPSIFGEKARTILSQYKDTP